MIFCCLPYSIFVLSCYNLRLNSRCQGRFIEIKILDETKYRPNSCLNWRYIRSKSIEKRIVIEHVDPHPENQYTWFKSLIPDELFMVKIMQDNMVYQHAFLHITIWMEFERFGRCVDIQSWVLLYQQWRWNCMIRNTMRKFNAVCCFFIHVYFEHSAICDSGTFECNL